MIDELGYNQEDFIFACYPLSFQTMKNLEEQYLQEDYLTEEKERKVGARKMMRILFMRIKNMKIFQFFMK